jgi:hypothetical protein
MTADWVAASVRARALTRRRLGRAGAERLAGAPSLASAVTALARTPYGRDVESGMDLRAATHGVFATLLWHLRVLAGWAPARGAERVRLLAAGFEIANVTARLARLEGCPAPPDYDLGRAWRSLAAARSAQDVRRALAASSWGDPGTAESAEIRMALQASWARRVADGVPEAAEWALSFAALVLARAVAAGTPPAAGGRAGRDLRSMLGWHWEGVRMLPELARRLPSSTAWLLDGIAGGDELWRAEARWWTRLESGGAKLALRPLPQPASVVGVAGLLAADAWRTRAALECAARGGDALALSELCDALA